MALKHDDSNPNYSLTLAASPWTPLPSNHKVTENVWNILFKKRCRVKNGFVLCAEKDQFLTVRMSFTSAKVPGFSVVRTVLKYAHPSHLFPILMRETFEWHSYLKFCFKDMQKRVVRNSSHGGYCCSDANTVSLLHICYDR